MLNEKQLKVVEATDHFIFLLAGAGTGKTTVIINKIKRLLKEDINAENILVLSFTRKSVNDLKNKFYDDNKILVTTFHGFCYNVLKVEKEIKIAKESWLIEKGFSLDDLTKIDFYKRNNKEPKIVRAYNKLLRKNDLVDYTDLEYIVLNKLIIDQVFKRNLINKYKYIFIDEFQDTSVVQYELIKQLLTGRSKCFCVGDPNQSIYSFRGASEKVIERYIKDYNARTYMLNVNYRSNFLILKASNKLIVNNKSSYPFDLIPAKTEKGEIIYKNFNSKKAKNNYIITEIRKLLESNIFQEEIAVIYRNHHFANELKKEIFKTYFERINLLTIHQVKGLEFDCVFFIGLEEDKLPFIGANLEEERRLFYVGITRAKKKLYLLAMNKNKISRFVYETMG